MKRIICDKCGKKFNSPMTYDVHSEEKCDSPTYQERSRIPRPCVMCGTWFRPEHTGRQITCSPECRTQRELQLKEAKYRPDKRLCTWCGKVCTRRFCSRACEWSMISQQRAHKKDNPFLSRPEPLTGKPFKGYEHYLADQRHAVLSAGHELAKPTAAVPSQRRKSREGQ